METEFSAEQLARPEIAEANSIIRSCVHCGFCTATCPSYQVLGDELDSPRGRIYLIKDMLENDRPADVMTVKHIDRCLSCLACTTTCPSGVDYMHLIDHARIHIERSYRRPLGDRLLRTLLANLLPYPERFRLALWLARLGRPLAGMLPGRLRAMVELAPRNLKRSAEPAGRRFHAPQGERRGRVALLAGCAQQVLDAGINRAAIRLLTRNGYEVVVTSAGCCGALTHHMGREDDARASARANINAWLAEADSDGLDAILVTTSGCGTVIKDYGHMFRDDPMGAQADRVAALARDVTEFLAGIDLPVLPDRGQHVAYHAACSLQHGQKIRDQPKTLLKNAGFRVSEPRDSHLCCGSAGTYNLLQPEISAELQARKVAHLGELRPDIIAAGNLGCMVQIGAGTAIPVVHTVELLDWAYGGPRPSALDAIKLPE